MNHSVSSEVVLLVGSTALSQVGSMYDAIPSHPPRNRCDSFDTSMAVWRTLLPSQCVVSPSRGASWLNRR